LYFTTTHPRFSDATEINNATPYFVDDIKGRQRRKTRINLEQTLKIMAHCIYFPIH